MIIKCNVSFTPLPRPSIRRVKFVGIKCARDPIDILDFF